MKTKKALICGALALSVLAVSACGSISNGEGGTTLDVGTQGLAGTASGNDVGASHNSEAPQHALEDFYFSEGMDENGFWQGINAIDYVDMFDYRALSIPTEVHVVPDSDVQEIINEMLQQHTSVAQIMDRAVENGDTVNIDFVGSADGVEFDGGSTMGMGTDVIIGETQFIDDFLDQLIGHMPGTTVNVEVTFPDDYFEASLAGVDALFVTTINYIAGDEMVPELTDTFVRETFGHMDDTLVTVAALKEDIRNFIQTNAIMQYIGEYIMWEVTVHSIPPAVLEYFEQEFLLQYADQGMQFGVGLEDMVGMLGFESLEDFLEEMRPDIESNARFSLVLQAIAQDAGITVGTADVSQFFIENFDTDDFSMFEEFYGLPWLKQFIRNEKVLDLIKEYVVFA